MDDGGSMDDNDSVMTLSEWLEIFRSAPLVGKIALIIFTTICISIPIWIVWNDPSALLG
jgi:hypothetical protein